jgi:hypothetical protein
MIFFGKLYRCGGGFYIDMIEFVNNYNAINMIEIPGKIHKKANKHPNIKLFFKLNKKCIL